MSLSSHWKLSVAAVMCATLSFGCYSKTTESKKPSGTTPGAAAPTGSGQRGPEMAGEGDEHKPGTTLSAEDQALADAQKFCPVSGEELGGEDMGPPVKEMVKGEPVFLCCKACIKKLHADEDKYLAKVAELKKGQPAEGKPE